MRRDKALLFYPVAGKKGGGIGVPREIRGVYEEKNRVGIA